MAYDRVFRVDEWMGKHAAELRRAGLTCGELRRRIQAEVGLDVSDPTVRTVAERHGIGLMKKAQNQIGPWLRAQLDAGVSFAQLSAVQIAAACSQAIGVDVTVAGVRPWLAEYNVDYRKVRGAGVKPKAAPEASPEASPRSKKTPAPSGRLIVRRSETPDLQPMMEILAQQNGHLVSLAETIAELSTAVTLLAERVEAALPVAGQEAPQPVVPEGWDSI